MDSLVEPEEDFSQPPWGELGRAFTLGVVSMGCKAVMHVMNTLHISGQDRFQDAVLRREEGQALFTVCNHTRCLSLLVKFSTCQWPHISLH